MEYSPEVWHILPGTPDIYIYIYIYMCVCVCVCVCVWSMLGTWHIENSPLWRFLKLQMEGKTCSVEWLWMYWINSCGHFRAIMGVWRRASTFATCYKALCLLLFPETDGVPWFRWYRTRVSLLHRIMQSPPAMLRYLVSGENIPWQKGSWKV